jgi:hypothetical protein
MLNCVDSKSSVSSLVFPLFVFCEISVKIQTFLSNYLFLVASHQLMYYITMFQIKSETVKFGFI